MREASKALGNLRGVLILLILAFHSVSAYIVSQPAHAVPFDQAPYDWRAFPIVDGDRWLGFDLFCAFQFLYLMQLMFFLSGLFVWPSLQRKDAFGFLRRRIVRLGVPFLLGVYLLMPIAYDAVYRASAVDPSWSAFWAHWRALPITPTGPMWFLWFLIALNLVAALVFWLLPNASRTLAPVMAKAAAYPGRFFVFVGAVTALAYLPLSAIYSPWYWAGWGPFEVQAAFAPQYAIYFLLGVAVGAYGYDRGLLDPHGGLVRCWPVWGAACLLSFFLWIIPTALIVKGQGQSIPGLSIIGDLGLVLFAAAACFAMLAIFLRFAAKRWPIIEPISDNAYGIYFYHYAFVLWLQFALLGVAMPAVGKGMLVFIGTVVLSWAASIVTSRIVAGARPLLRRGAVLLAMLGGRA